LMIDDDTQYDFQMNNTASVIFGTDREDVLARIQRGFERQYNQYGRLKKDDINSFDYETLRT